MAGVSRLQYANEIRLVRVMCSGRVDLEFILRAFSKGHDGVFIGGCKLNECNYVTHGNYDALANTYLCKKLMESIGLNPERLSVEFMSGGDGILLVDLINSFTQKVNEMGPLGQAEGIDAKDLEFKIEAARKLVPYLKLVERERLRVASKSEDAYRSFYTSNEFERLFDELITDKWAISQIMLLLDKKPCSTGEIAETLSLNSSEVSKHMSSSSRHGLIKYNVDSKCYQLA